MSTNLPMPNGFMVYDHNQMYGPYPLADLRNRHRLGQFSAEARVSRYGSEEWMSLNDFIQGALLPDVPAPAPAPVRLMRIPTLPRLPEVRRAWPWLVALVCLVAAGYGVWWWSRLPVGRVNGTVFITTNMGDSKQLGAVRISLHEEEAVRPMLIENGITMAKQVVQFATRTLELAGEAETLISELSRLDEQGQNLRLEAIELTRKINQTKLDNPVLTPAMSQLLAQWNKRIAECKAGALERERAWARKAMASDDIVRASRLIGDGSVISDRSLRCFWDNLPAPAGEAVSGPQGEFRIEVPRKGRYLVMAYGQRKSFGVEEYYTWIVPLEVTRRGDVELNLNNANMVSERGLPYENEIKAAVEKMPEIKLRKANRA